VRVASIARHTFLKFVRWQVIDELREYSLADIHFLIVGNRNRGVCADGLGVDSAGKLSNRKIQMFP
jgi:hypothetical protein